LQHLLLDPLRCLAQPFILSAPQSVTPPPKEDGEVREGARERERKGKRGMEGRGKEGKDGGARRDRVG
jgi:hypothetical protein